MLQGNLLRQFQNVTDASEDLLSLKKPSEDPETEGSRTVNHQLQKRQLIVYSNVDSLE